MGGKIAAAVTAALVAVGAHARATTEQTRVIGHGQIRYKGAGPERWAYRFQRERRVVALLQRRFAARIERIVYLVRAFECVHQHEAPAWSTSTGNGYFGGLQFDSVAWRVYGSRYASRADLASPSQQIAAAIAYQTVSGFWPWPNTARACGLLPTGRSR